MTFSGGRNLSPPETRGWSTDFSVEIMFPPFCIKYCKHVLSLHASRIACIHVEEYTSVSETEMVSTGRIELSRLEPWEGLASVSTSTSPIKMSESTSTWRSNRNGDEDLQPAQTEAETELVYLHNPGLFNLSLLWSSLGHFWLRRCL